MAKSSPKLLVLGHVTCDHIGTETRLGGSAAFAARAATRLGVDTALITAAPVEFELLNPLLKQRGLEVQIVDSPLPTTFELNYLPTGRVIRYLSGASPLQPGHIPDTLRSAPVAYVGPVIGECGSAIIESLAGSHIIVGAQGWLRSVEPDGRLVPALQPEAKSLPEGIAAIVFSELDHPDAENLARRFADRCPIVALTRGEAGSTLFHEGRMTHIAAAPAQEVDPTGAGDVYALVLGLGLHAEMPVMEAAAMASFAAARVVEGPGMEKLTQMEELQALLRALDKS